MKQPLKNQNVQSVYPMQFSARAKSGLRISPRLARAFAQTANLTKMFHVKQFGTIQFGFCFCSLTSPLAHLSFDPEWMRRIDPKDF